MFVSYDDNRWHYRDGGDGGEMFTSASCVQWLVVRCSLIIYHSLNTVVLTTSEYLM